MKLFILILTYGYPVKHTHDVETKNAFAKLLNCRNRASFISESLYEQPIRAVNKIRRKTPKELIVLNEK